MCRVAKDRHSSAAILWFRQDLRVIDNPALSAAAAGGQAVLPVYILDTTDHPWRMGAASLWWLHHSLISLRRDLKRRYKLDLVFRHGDPARVIPELIAETGAGAVYWNRRYEPASIAADTALKATLTNGGIAVATFNAALLYEPWTVKTQAKGWFKVFSPFWRACRALPPPAPPQPAPAEVTRCSSPVPSDDLAEWNLLPTKPDWAGGLRALWQPGEPAALTRLKTFLDEKLCGYAARRDLPDADATSRLSPHLHFGEIGPRQIWHAVQMVVDRGAPGVGRNAEKLFSELGWREFTHHLLFHFPDLPERNFRSEFDGFPWRNDPALLRAWQRGCTGYPIVDAGMRELWRSGWMHNRVRMITASFLIKHLRQHWREGSAWFWDTLVDADLANNAASWQWVAGSGADAAPYFRIFNPILQGEKFDPRGAYVRRWVPELAGLPDKFIHKPWLAPAAIMRQAGLVIGRDYPEPLVEHNDARRQALEAFASLRGEYSRQ